MSIARARQYAEAAARHRAQAAKWEGGPVRALLLYRARVADEACAREVAYSYGRRRRGLRDVVAVPVAVHEPVRVEEDDDA